jgi:plasminogen activator inhibitor 1 RNA-binding protein
VEEAATNDAAAEGATDWAATNDNGWSGAQNTSNDWGVDAAPANDDAWGQTTTSTADAEPAPTSPTGAADADKSGRERKGREPEEEDNTLTLDQYLAQKKDSDVVPKLEGVRKANDGADDIWRDAVPLKKDQQQDTYFVGKVR